MRAVGARAFVEFDLETVEALWYDRVRWPDIVEGFGRVERIDESWPEPGARLVWVSSPHGRGTVIDRSTAYAPGRGQTIETEDEQLRGTQAVQFTEVDEGVEVDLSLEYELKTRNVFSPIVDLLFIRRNLADHLHRTLARFARELAADRDLLGDG